MCSPYVPLSNGLPSTETGSLNSIVVFSFAPARQTLPYGTRPPQIFRPFTNGRWYLIAMSVNAMRCFTSAAWLTSGRFKSFCAEAIWPRPTTARQRTSGLSVIVFILWRGQISQYYCFFPTNIFFFELYHILPARRRH